MHGGRERGVAADGGRESPRCLRTDGRGERVPFDLFGMFLHFLALLTWNQSDDRALVEGPERAVMRQNITDPRAPAGRSSDASK